MPGIPLVARETIQSRSGDQSCRQDSRLVLSAEEEIAAEESLSLYCKPVELYNILQHRTPSFLQRCLRYKVQARNYKRIRMSVSLSGKLDDGMHVSSLFPVHIILARLQSNVSELEHTEIYRYTSVRTLTRLSREDGNVARAHFILPEMDTLVKEAKPESLFILIVSYVRSYTSNNFDPSTEHLNNSSFPIPSTTEKSCLWSKIPMDSLFVYWRQFPIMYPGGAEMLSFDELNPCVLKCGFLGEANCISFQISENSSSMSTLPQVQVKVSAEEQGVKDKSSYNPYRYNILPASSPHVYELRAGNVIFNYMYYHNKLKKTEVTEDFSCPFCLVKCASFKGMKLHLRACHDLFQFEFWVTDEYQAVNVSIKSDLSRSEIFGGAIDPKQLIFSFCYKPLKRRKSKGLLDKGKHVHPLTSDFAAAASDLLNKTDDAYSSRIERARSSSVNESLNDADCIQSTVVGSTLAPPATLQFAKTRKLSERSDSRRSANI